MDLNKLRGMANQQLFKHNLHLDWTFGFGDFGRRLGVCKYRKQRIEIAEHYALNNPEEHVFGTLIHEISHALAGPYAKHGPIWKAKAIELGIKNPQSCDRTGAIVKPGNWEAICDCGKVYYKYKNSAGLEERKFRCTGCKGLIQFVWIGEPEEKPEPIEQWKAQCKCSGFHYRRSLKNNATYNCRQCKTSLVWFR